MDTTKTVKCPACKNTMQKVRISDTGFTIDMCLNGCGGILFDNQELNKILESGESLTKIVHYMETKTFVFVDESERRFCPVCGTPMVKIGAKSGTEIDSCNACGATFLDNGELKKIKNITENRK